MATEYRNETGGVNQDLSAVAEQPWVLPMQKGTFTLRESVAEVNLSDGQEITIDLAMSGEHSGSLMVSFVDTGCSYALNLHRLLVECVVEHQKRDPDEKSSPSVGQVLNIQAGA